MKKTIKENDLVFPGEYLGVVEEFLPDKATTFVQEGKIFATKSGFVSIDERKREIEIKNKNEDDRKTPRAGDKIIGTVLFLRKFSIGLSFFTLNGKVHFNSSYMGNVHVSQISSKYVEKINDAFQITDIIRAKVTEEKSNEFTLTTVGKELGVLHADCAVCGTTLTKISFNKLRCEFCGNVELRKLADDYGNVEEHLRY